MVYKGSNSCSLGEYANNWAEEDFIPFSGVLELFN